MHAPMSQAKLSRDKIFQKRKRCKCAKRHGWQVCHHLFLSAQNSVAQKLNADKYFFMGQIMGSCPWLYYIDFI